ncbi:MAG: hypothetical protein D6801_02725 [Alphaproteobacteria bacterium]|nr:MAG: hypothetical protein D6801_02725 [Alphaproteobacteria bacterium]
MKISIHLGVHCTDEDALVKSLLKNVKTLSAEGVVVPAPGRYRPLLRKVLEKLAGNPPGDDVQDVLLEQILDTEQVERLVLSHDSFLAVPAYALRNGLLYRNAGRNTMRLRRLFPDHEVEFFLAVRDPATFVPALHEKLPEMPFAELAAGASPETLVWSDVVRDIRESNPDCPVTVWCNEDTPLIWPEVMHEITGIEPRVPFVGGFDILSKIMEREGMVRLRAYLNSHPPATEIQRRRILAAFLDKYAIEEAVEEEIDLPGWTPELVEELSQAYDDDMIEMARIPGVTVLTA